MKIIHIFLKLNAQNLPFTIVSPQTLKVFLACPAREKKNVYNLPKTFFSVIKNEKGTSLILVLKMVQYSLTSFFFLIPSPDPSHQLLPLRITNIYKVGVTACMRLFVRV